ncbi:hypothetical protein DRZ78_03135 [Candidatus Aerophobetes bacterium]|uniref:HEPN domain-containing protein n=1 Tax=Aerophobetes bacterium TaxID=2030807 RepID=A0A662D239_UNCAE|nr:MAG: hypothetical protein DRZ78_03135 [Candidatus Aerophobetes bacterium]
MSFDWRDYIRLAEDLMRHNEEAYARTVISRAYYGVFCLSRNKAGFRNYKESNVHQKVIKHYQKSKNDNEQYVGKVLDDLRKERNDADYNEDKVINSQLAHRVLLKAIDLLKRLGTTL